MEDNSKNISINITTGTIFKALLIILSFYVLYLLLNLVLVILTAVVLASSIEPATKWFARYKIPRIPAVIIVYAVIAVVVIGIFYFFIPPLLEDASKLSAVLPEYMETIMVPDSVKGGLFGVDKIVGDLSETISFGDLILQAKEEVFSLSGGVFEAVSRIFGGAFSFILIVVISFYLAVQENGISNFLKLITPIRQQKYVIDLWKRTQVKIGLWMQGQLLLGLIIGILVFLGLTILKVPYALLLAILAAMFEIIPIFGPILAAIPAIILGFFVGGFTMGMFVTGLYIIIQQFENHLIYPLVVRKVVGVPPLLVIIAIVAGGVLAGFLGMLLSVPAAAALVEFTNDIAKEKKIF